MNDWMSDESKQVGESAKHFPTWQGVSWRVRGNLRWAGGPILWMCSDTSRRHPTSHNLNFFGSGGWVKSRKELMNSFCVTNKVVV